MKPALDRMTDLVVQALSGEARSFYDREFNFFHEVTSISGKLKPYIKKTKPEKKVSFVVEYTFIVLTFLKAKIDEEMAKICVDVGVYLPSNPDGKVVDIDKRSGRPLQSHAKVSADILPTGENNDPTLHIGSFHGHVQSPKGARGGGEGSRGLTRRIWHREA